LHLREPAGRLVATETPPRRVARTGRKTYFPSALSATEVTPAETSTPPDALLLGLDELEMLGATHRGERQKDRHKMIPG